MNKITRVREYSLVEGRERFKALSESQARTFLSKKQVFQIGSLLACCRDRKERKALPQVHSLHRLLLKKWKKRLVVQEERTSKKFIRKEKKATVSLTREPRIKKEKKQLSKPHLLVQKQRLSLVIRAYPDEATSKICIVDSFNAIVGVDVKISHILDLICHVNRLGDFSELIELFFQNAERRGLLFLDDPDFSFYDINLYMEESFSPRMNFVYRVNERAKGLQMKKYERILNSQDPQI